MVDGEAEFLVKSGWVSWRVRAGLELFSSEIEQERICFHGEHIRSGEPFPMMTRSSY